MQTGHLGVFSKPKVLLVIVIVLLGLFILSRTSIFHLEPALDASWLQQLRQTAPLDVTQLHMAGGASNGCSRTLDQSLLLIPAGQSCRFTIDPAPRGLFPLTRILTMTLVVGTISEPTLVEMSFEDKPLTAEQRLVVDTPAAVEIPQGGGQITIPICTSEQDSTTACVIQVGAYLGNRLTPAGSPTNVPGSK